MHQVRGVSGKELSAFAVCVLLGVALFLVPALIIQPFRYQSPASLKVAMTVAQHSPLWTLVAAIAALALAFLLWRRSTARQRTIVVAGMVLVSGAATMSRIDYFEWMFHPVPSPGFTAAGESKMAD